MDKRTFLKNTIGISVFPSLASCLSSLKAEAGETGTESTARSIKLSLRRSGPGMEKEEAKIVTGVIVHETTNWKIIHMEEPWTRKAFWLRVPANLVLPCMVEFEDERGRSFLVAHMEVVA